MTAVRQHDYAHQVPPGLKGLRALDRDKLSMVSRHDAAHGAHMALFQLQDIPDPETQVLGVATLFAAVCLRCGLDPADTYSKGHHVLVAPTSGDVATSNSMEVLRDFIGARIMAKEVTIG